jgi:exodeoxyribonuclease-5
VFLEEVHRQAMDSPILRLATMAREGKRLEFGTWDAGEAGRARVLPMTGKTAAAAYRPFTQTICGTHRVRYACTAKIRALRGFEGELPQPGELIMCKKNNRDINLFNGLQGKLLAEPRPYERFAGDDESYTPLVHFDVQMDDHRLPLLDLLVHPWMFWKHDGGEVERPRARKTIEWFDFGYVLTAHSAQGSEWPNVTVIDDSGAFREDRHRWAYTAITRASESMTFLRRG